MIKRHKLDCTSATGPAPALAIHQLEQSQLPDSTQSQALSLSLPQAPGRITSDPNSGSASGGSNGPLPARFAFSTAAWLRDFEIIQLQNLQDGGFYRVRQHPFGQPLRKAAGCAVPAAGWLFFQRRFEQ